MEYTWEQLRELCDLACVSATRQRLLLIPQYVAGLTGERSAADATAIVARLPRLIGEAKIEALPAVVSALEGLRQTLGG